MPQSLAGVFLHAILSTKGRQAVPGDAWRDGRFQVLGSTTNNLGCQSWIVGGVADHVHMLFPLARTISVADAVGLG